jgi:hypothetical protein
MSRGRKTEELGVTIWVITTTDGVAPTTVDLGVMMITLVWLCVRGGWLGAVTTCVMSVDGANAAIIIGKRYSSRNVVSE